jgi:lipoprotein NlpI
MKKALFIIAAIVVVDAIASVALLWLVWHPLLGLGSTQLVRTGQQLMTRREYKGAVTVFSEALMLDSRNVEAYARRAYARLDLKDYPGAIADADRAIAIDPHYALGYGARGLAREWTHDNPGALADYDQAVGLQPDIAAYHAIRARLRIESNDINGALSDADRAIELHPQNALAYYYRGVALRRQGEAHDAVASFARVLEINPHYIGALFERGVAKYVDGDLEGAKSDLRTEQGDEVDAAYAKIWLWLIACEQGQKQQADRDLTASLAADRNVKDGTWPEQLGDLLLGRVTPEALVQKIDPSKSEGQRKDEACQVWFYAGKIALLRGDKIAARDYFTKAVAADAHAHLEFSEAQRELKKL